MEYLPILVIFALTALGIFLYLWVPAFRLRRALARPFPRAHELVLRRHLPAWRSLPPQLKLQLQRLIKQFLFEKTFVGCDGLTVTDEMRVTIAAKAGMLLLNRQAPLYPKLDTVLVYPSAFVAPRNEVGIGGIVTHASHQLAGESWSDGRVILAWDHVLRGGIDGGHDVALHEFAHQLDSESGSVNGAPLMPASRYARWSAVMSMEFERLQLAATYGAPSVLDYYGATNPAEFFAVATEAFHGRPHELAEAHPALFEELRGYYRVDPRAWVAPLPMPVPVF